MVIGRLGKTETLLLRGRAHYYEGYSMSQITFPVRVLAAFGITHLLLTNAAGGINKRFRPGDLMLIRDHINLMPDNPLRGIAHNSRFLDLTRTYDPGLAILLRNAARSLRIGLHVGVYMAVPGPSYETPAEIRAFARLGADAVGMSTVPEAIVARHCGMAVAGLSFISNIAAGLGESPIAHQDVLTTGERINEKTTDLLAVFLERFRSNTKV
jgi:purine-nucleoside phosphorylase